MPRLSISDLSDPELTTALQNGLKDYSEGKVPERVQIPISISLTDPAGKIIGGLKGSSYWGWLHVNLIWVDQSLRGQGWGKSLMTAAENEARKRGCKSVLVDTHTFQAPKFYENLGYTVFGRLEDFPPGFSRVYLRKKLS